MRPQKDMKDETETRTRTKGKQWSKVFSKVLLEKKKYILSKRVVLEFRIWYLGQRQVINKEQSDEEKEIKKKKLLSIAYIMWWIIPK